MSANHPIDGKKIAPSLRHLYVPQKAPGKWYLTHMICELCGYTLDYDNQGPRLLMPGLMCEGACKQFGIKSLMVRSNK